MPEKKKLLEVKDLKVVFGSGKKAFTAIDGVSFDIYEGETFGLVGESGSGKTTIGRPLSGSMKPPAERSCMRGSGSAERSPRRWTGR